MTMYIASTPLSPTPPAYTMATSEIAPLSLDCTPLLTETQSVASASCVLTDLSVGRGTVVALGHAAQVVSPTITQIVDGSILTAGHIYRLDFNFVVDAETHWTQSLAIHVPQ